MKILLFVLATFFYNAAAAQAEEALLQQVRAKLAKVNDYEATGKMKLDVAFIKAPAGKVTVFYKKPNRFKVKKEGGISVLPKGGVSVNANSLLLNSSYQTIPGGTATIDGFVTTVVKIIPTDEASDVVLSVLYIDEKEAVMRKAVVTTKENGTYQVSMSYGNYIAWGLPDKLIFSFNTKDYKLPKGITFEYEKGGEKKTDDKAKTKKGRVEITYSNYIINKGVDDKNFQ